MNDKRTIVVFKNDTTATFHSFRGDKSALVMVKPNALSSEQIPAYVPKAAVAKLKEGDVIPVPGGFWFKDMYNYETGELCTAEDGSILKQLSWSNPDEYVAPVVKEPAEATE